MKYIDADRLREELNKWRDIQPTTVGLPRKATYEAMGVIQTIDHVLYLVASLQQEQPEVQNGKFVFPKYLYARSKDNKTIDMSYAPQDMAAVEYIRNDFVEQEQPVEGLEEELEKMWLEWCEDIDYLTYASIARHFAEWGAEHLKKVE